MKETLLIEKVGETSAEDGTVDRVILEAFRNYSTLDLCLGSGFNLFVGPNAQGKTNFLEALYLVSTTRLLRGQRDAEAVFQTKDRASVIVELFGSGTRLGVSLERGVRKRASLNGLNLPRAADLLGRLPCVCVSSADMEIVRGDPSERRLFLDLELSALFPAYLRHLTLYKRALEQRNALLRDSREWPRSPELFETWEEQMAHHGASIREARDMFVGRLEPDAQEVHANLGNGERLQISYVRRDETTDEAALLAALAQCRNNDIARGGTSVGPHRDDLAIEIDDKEARLFGSQGQQRTSVIALKLAHLKLVCEELGRPPLLLLDDIFSDLDQHRRELLVETVLKNAGQTVLTCTEASAAGHEILERARVFNVKAGEVTPA